jgi:hypothetical protein
MTADQVMMLIHSVSAGPRTMSEVTRILHEIESGDPVAADLLLPLVYDE